MAKSALPPSRSASVPIVVTARVPSHRRRSIVPPYDAALFGPDDRAAATRTSTKVFGTTLAVPRQRARGLVDDQLIGLAPRRDVECMLLRLDGRRELAGFSERGGECLQREDV